MIQAKINPVPILAMLVLGAALTLVSSCGKGMPDPTFKSVADGNIRFNNRSKGRFVVFRDTISPKTVIGGVLGSTNDFRLKTEPVQQILRVVSVEEYVRNRKDITKAKPVLVEFVDASKPVVITLSNMEPLAGYVYYRNFRDSYIAIRDKSWAGKTLAVVAPGESGPQYVGFGDKKLYPVVVAYDKSSGRMIDVERMSNAVALRFVGNSTNVSVIIKKPR